ncbi:MAG: hypothetical protein RI947_470 [Candidatus Parcubacteria bacterium]|jgi:fructose-1,6-bisphosphatase I
MSNSPTTLTSFILTEELAVAHATGSFTILMNHIEDAVKIIASHVKKTGLVDILGHTGDKNVYGEDVQKLDEFSNRILIDLLSDSKQVCMIASEELEKPITVQGNGCYSVYFDPLDGSSVIDTAMSIGTIFSVYRHTPGTIPNGNQQIAAGYALYGSSVVFVYTFGKGVNGFTLDPSIGSFLLSNPNIRIPSKNRVYAVNEGYSDLYDSGMKKYLKHIKSGKDLYKLRYAGAMVADIHRTLLHGGIFMYPKDKKNPDGKLRLMYEVNPMSFIITQAGGKAFSREGTPLDIEPSAYDQRVPVILGSSDEVDTYIELSKS